MNSNALLLKDLIVVTKDGDWGTDSPRIGFMPCRVIRGADFPAAREGNITSIPLRYLDSNSIWRRILIPDDILIETAGGNRDRPTGRTLLITDRLLNSLDLQATCASFARFIRIDSNNADPKYVYWYLQHLYERGKMWEHQVQHTGVARFQYTRFAETTFIPLPPMVEQRAIARILGALDDKIELNRRMNRTLEAMAQALFKSWFVDFDPVTAKAEGRTPFGMNAETAALFPAEFVDSELGKIPKGWRVGSLGSLFESDRDVALTGPFGSNLHAHDYRDVGVPLILVKHVNDGYISDDDLPLVGNHKVPELGRYRLKTGDIVFTRVGAVGRSAYVHKRHEGWMISGQMLRIRVPHTQILLSRYLAQVYLQPEFLDMVEGHALGTTRPSLNTEILLSFKFLVPPYELQRQFVNTITKFDAKVNNNIAESRTLASIRDALLPKLLSGEIRLGQAEKIADGVI